MKKNRPTQFGDQLRMQALPFTSLNFHLNLCLFPLCHPLPAALHPPALKFPLLFFMADFSGGALDHLLVHISPIAWKKSSSLLYSKSKIKGGKKKKATKETPSALRTIHHLHGVHEWWSVDWLHLSHLWKLSFLGQPTTKIWLRRSNIRRSNVGPRNLYFSGSFQVIRMCSQILNPLVIFLIFHHHWLQTPDKLTCSYYFFKSHPWLLTARDHSWLLCGSQEGNSDLLSWHSLLSVLLWAI